MKTKHITLQQSIHDDDRYIVVLLINCIEPNVGKVLTRVEVGQLIQRRDTKVTIKRAKT